MADETPVATPAPAEPAPAPQDVERARAGFERAAEKAGIREPVPAPDRPAEGVRTGEEGQPGRDLSDARPAADPGKADRDFHERQQRRADEVRQARYLSALEKVAQQALREEQEREAPESPAPEDELNPYDRETQWFEWDEWNEQAREKRILAAMDQRLKPFADLFETRRRQDEAAAQQRQAQAQREAWRSEMYGIARDAHETYSADPDSAGYMDRVTWMVGHDGHPGDAARGIPAVPPQDGALTLGFLAAFPNLPEEEARAMARRHVDGMMMVAREYNRHNPHAPVNPARALDLFTRVQLAAAIQFLQGGGGATASAGGNGNGAGHAALPPAPSAAQQRVAAAKEAASSGLAGSGAEGGARGGSDVATYLKSELASGKRLGVDAMRRIALKFYGKTNAQALGKLARDIAAVERELRGA